MTTMIIQFIGLILFTGKITAIAPAIPSGSGVESHTTMILYKCPPADPGCVTSVTGWTAKTTAGWSYVELSGGMQLEILSGTVNGPVNALSSLGLPKPGGKALKPAYQPPSYSGANAVFKIKEGTLAACTSGTRADTWLTLNVKQLTIQTKTGDHSIVFKPDATVAIVNVPLGMLNDPMWTPTGSPHTDVYCIMTGQSAGCTLGATTGGTCPHLSVISSESMLSTDFACSNSQWP